MFATIQVNPYIMIEYSYGQKENKQIHLQYRFMYLDLYLDLFIVRI